MDCKKRLAGKTLLVCHSHPPTLALPLPLPLPTPLPPDRSIGTIFGVYATTTSNSDPAASVLQPGSRLLVAGYALYSSATMLVVSVGAGVHGFTLDPTIGEFVLTHPDMKMPQRGQIYSLNDAR